MDRGRVVLAPFPYSDLRGLKRRPACVVSSTDYNVGPDVIVAMVTSSRSRVERPGVGDVAILLRAGVTVSRPVGGILSRLGW